MTAFKARSSSVFKAFKSSVFKSFGSPEIGPVTLTILDDAGILSGSYIARRFNSLSVLQETSTGTVFIFGEGLAFMLDAGMGRYSLESRNVFAGRITAFVTGPFATTTWNTQPPNMVPGGSPVLHPMVQTADAVGTDPYTKSNENNANMTETGIATIAGYKIWSQKTPFGTVNRQLIAVCEFTTPWSFVSGDFATLDIDWTINL